MSPHGVTSALPTLHPISPSQVLNNPTYLEDVSGLTQVKAEAEASLATLQWDDDDFGEEMETDKAEGGGSEDDF